MAALEDTNLLHRGGPDGLAFAQQLAAQIASMPISQRSEALTEMDRIMILRNLSPGGSADMLALAFLLESWRDLSAALRLPQSDSTSDKGGTL
jgi:triphosphoribosyl-dephospho-CoA synthase